MTISYIGAELAYNLAELLCTSQTMELQMDSQLKADKLIMITIKPSNELRTFMLAATGFGLLLCV